MPLKISLKPGEAVVVNGAVLRNGDRRGTMLLENHARVLREKDVIQVDEVNTPGQRAYFAVMQAYLTGQTDGAIYDQVASALTYALSAANDDDHATALVNISRACAVGETYQALSLCRNYMKSEAALNEGGQHG